MSQAELAPFQTLVKLVERELEVAGQGDAGLLERAVAETGAHISMLPDPAPPAARPLIERARGMRGRVEIEAERLRDAITLSRVANQRKKTMARTYGPQSASRGYSTSA